MSYVSNSPDLTLLAPEEAQLIEEHVEIEGVGRVTVESGIFSSESAEAAGLLSKKSARTPRSRQRARGRRGSREDPGVDVALSGEGFVVLLQVKAAKPSSPEAGRALRDFVVGLKAALTQSVHEPGRLTELTQLISPTFDPPSVPALLQARRNTQARKELLDEFGALTAAQLAEARHASKANPSALASRWRKEGRVFGVTFRDKTEHEKTYFPGFQFDDQLKPLEVVGRVLEIFAPHAMTEWEIALWFTTPNGWLEDNRPVDLLQDDPDSVVASAEHEVAAIAG
jgi:hypothetical protein